MVPALPFQCSVIVEPALVCGFCWSPTAQMSVAETAATPRREMKPPTAFIEGADTFAHEVPFQCSTMSDTFGLVWKATAQTLLVARAVTPKRGVSPGLETIVQLLPFQCAMRVKRPMALGSSKKPTAHTLVEERANTPSSSTLANCAGGFGLGTMLHLVPFQCSIKVCLTKAAPPGSGPKPTAQTSVEETAATA